MKIGLSVSDINHGNYPKWLEASGQKIEIITLDFKANNAPDIENCEGLVLTGGVDIYPSFFLENASENYENAPKSFLINRDSFELELLKRSLEMKIPILGICRGLQLINVYFGGTLKLDIGAKSNTIHKKENFDKVHNINILTDSFFRNIVDINEGEVNSAHHQAIDILGVGLRAVAFSEDQIIECIELEKPDSQFLLAVQWHPERMIDPENVLNKNIREAFLNAIILC
jgi:putative glutamine amidotransferase